VIAALPRTRQTLFFSATMPSEISKLADQILKDPARIAVTPVASTAERIFQAVFHVEENQKTSLLIHLLGDPRVTRSLVFTRTKRDANRVAEFLVAARIGAEAIHGNKSQGARERALESIKNGASRVLVATDIAARGIDIDGVSHVFNYDIPNIPESYVHRIGRTARAGNAGMAVSFCSGKERAFLADIERLIRKRVPLMKTPEGLAVEARKRGRGGRSRRHGGGGRSSHHGPRH
jgi:ATP-dependent RNA helicase RhlE